MEGTAFILVRSVVANPDDRKAFDHWYHTDHIPLIFSTAHSMSVIGVRREKAALSSGCEAHPATAPAGSNRSSHGGNEVAEAFG